MPNHRKMSESHDQRRDRSSGHNSKYPDRNGPGRYNQDRNRGCEAKSVRDPQESGNKTEKSSRGRSRSPIKNRADGSLPSNPMPFVKCRIVPSLSLYNQQANNQLTKLDMSPSSSESQAPPELTDSENSHTVVPAEPDLDEISLPIQVQQEIGLKPSNTWQRSRSRLDQIPDSPMLSILRDVPGAVPVGAAPIGVVPAGALPIGAVPAAPVVHGRSDHDVTEDITIQSSWSLQSLILPYNPYLCLIYQYPKLTQVFVVFNIMTEWNSFMNQYYLIASLNCYDGCSPLLNSQFNHLICRMMFVFASQIGRHNAYQSAVNKFGLRGWPGVTEWIDTKEFETEKTAVRNWTTPRNSEEHSDSSCAKPPARPDKLDLLKKVLEVFEIRAQRKNPVVYSDTFV